MLITVVVYDGVLDDECEAFRSVLGLVNNASVITVGARHGTYAGPGGLQHVDATFDEIDTADIVIVPGGLGCERAADDPVLRQFLLRMEQTARFVAGSSTGTVVLASAGLLHGESAATHWLAKDLLRNYGSHADPRGLVVTGNVITCEGRISAVDAAFALVERIEGSAAIAPIRSMLIERGQPLLRQPSRWKRLSRRLSDEPKRTRVRDLAPNLAGRAEVPMPIQPPVDQPPPITPIAVMIELIDNEELKRQLKRRRRRPRGRPPRR